MQRFFKHDAKWDALGLGLNRFSSKVWIPSAFESRRKKKHGRSSSIGWELVGMVGLHEVSIFHEMTGYNSDLAVHVIFMIYNDINMYIYIYTY